jgi:hypothetical protein
MVRIEFPFLVWAKNVNYIIHCEASVKTNPNWFYNVTNFFDYINFNVSFLN